MRSLVFSQCSDSIKIINIDSCEVVQTSLKSFNSIYKYKASFKEVSYIVDSLSKIDKSLDSSIKKEMNRLDEQKKEIHKEFIDCENENSYLMRSNNRLKKQRNIYSALGLFVGVLITIVIM